MTQLPRQSDAALPARSVQIDLTGSTTHEPEFRSVEVTGDWPQEWDDARLRAEAATWAGVPVEQVVVLHA